ncbi:MAG: amidohydrolase family protein [Pseudomonadota bacterium]
MNSHSDQEAALLAAQAWRTETPGHAGWERSVRPDDTNKYYVISADCHAIEPKDWMTGYIADDVREQLRNRRARREKEMDQERAEGVREPKEAPEAGNGAKKEASVPTHLLDRSKMAGEDLERFLSGRYPDERVKDNVRDGVDAEIIFPGAAFLAAQVANDDPALAMRLCEGWNNWARDWYGDHWDVQFPMAFITTADVDAAVAEIERVAALGFKGVCLPNKPVYGPQPPRERNYNLPEFDPIWAALQDTNLPATFHVSTGRNPTTTRGPGGAVANYVSHCCTTNIEPLVLLCSSGICERFPSLRFAVVESGIGWVSWSLEAMDEAYRKHHMWAKPKLPELPSYYFRRQGYATFGEDRSGLAVAAEFDLVDNFCWASDYPHPEGSWPHSPEAIERQMGRLTDQERAKILGGNAARLLGIEIPARQQ